MLNITFCGTNPNYFLKTGKPDMDYGNVSEVKKEKEEDENDNKQFAIEYCMNIEFYEK